MDLAQTRSGYDAVADRYAAEIGDELAGKPLDRGLLAAFAELTAGGPVLDVGCGPGHLTAWLGGRGSAVAGMDLSPGMCAVGHRTTRLPYAAADMTALPVRSGALVGLLCLYAVIHLDATARAAAYREFARVLRPGGYALVAFHTRDAGTGPGGERVLSEWWGHEVSLTFRFLDPDGEAAAMAGAGFQRAARLDRAPNVGAGPDAEHASERAYLLMRRR
ncbi:class I SAM-dependent methyltransferase [Rhizomonospora bruguierae]|uniref:class I SAM-dependent methyltransferase n=1 Tax=Rhizomonospora bruguierae TaxID=1581705 RepID=UPI001BCC3BA6|nr:class I SAM-dependent methyltransferase [Micromonospora sp. NBRC 107566]